MYCWHAHISICQITVCLMHLFLKCITVHAKIRSFLPSDNKEKKKFPYSIICLVVHFPIAFPYNLKSCDHRLIDLVLNSVINACLSV
jgi:hypothetical protein